MHDGSANIIISTSASENCTVEVAVDSSDSAVSTATH